MGALSCERKSISAASAMQLLIKSISRKSFSLEVNDPQATVVRDIKLMLQNMGAAGGDAEMTLLFKGRVLEDEESVEGLAVGTGFLVMMVRDVKERKKKATKQDAAMGAPGEAVKESSAAAAAAAAAAPSAA